MMRGFLPSTNIEYPDEGVDDVERLRVCSEFVWCMVCVALCHTTRVWVAANLGGEMTAAVWRVRASRGVTRESEQRMMD